MSISNGGSRARESDGRLVEGRGQEVVHEGAVGAAEAGVVAVPGRADPVEEVAERAPEAWR